MERPSIFEFAGGEPAFLALAAALHERCLADAELNHPFSHAGPHHLENLAAYMGEVFGGPTRYSDSHGGQSAMLDIHAGEGAGEDLGVRFAACFMQAVDDAQLPGDPQFRSILKSFIDEATSEVIAYSPRGSRVPAGLRIPRWGWDGPE
jgi:hemoglobin